MIQLQKDEWNLSPSSQYLSYAAKTVFGVIESLTLKKVSKVNNAYYTVKFTNLVDWKGDLRCSLGKGESWGFMRRKNKCKNLAYIRVTIITYFSICKYSTTMLSPQSSFTTVYVTSLLRFIRSCLHNCTNTLHCSSTSVYVMSSKVLQNTLNNLYYAYIGGES